MSIVEQAVDSIKTEESIKELCHGDVIKVASKDISVKMDSDTTETKTEKQTNGSSSVLKKDVDKSTEKVESESLKKSPTEDENASKVEQMDVDASTNGNGNGVASNEGSPEKNGKEAEEEEDETIEKNGKETDETSGESKTDAKIENEKKEEKDDEKAESNQVDEEKSKKVENSEEETKENPINEKVESKEDIDDKTKEEINNEDVEMKEPEDKKRKLEDEKASAESDNVDENNKEVKESKNENSKVDDKNETNIADVEMKEVEEPTKETDKSTIIDESKEKEVTEDVSKSGDDKAPQGASNIDVSDSKVEESKDASSVDDNKTQEESMSTPDEEKKTDVVGNEAPSENSDQLPKVSTEESKDNTENDEVNREEEKPVENDEGTTKPTVPQSEKLEDDPAVKKVNNNVEKEEKEKTPPPTETKCTTPKEEATGERGKTEQKTSKEEISNEDQNKSTVNGTDQEVPEVNAEDGKISSDAGTEEPKGPTDTCKDDETKAGTSRLEESTADTEKVEDEKEKETENKEDLVKDEEDALHQTAYVDENRFFESGTIVELSRIAWDSGVDKQQYVRGCLWSPDGTCILTAVNMDGMHVINLPNDLYSNESTSGDRPVDKLESVINVKEGGTVYDYCWYPFMNSTMPETCCWLSSRQHCPIQLWDGFTGDLRGSYRGYDNVDEVEAAFSVTFTSDAEKIIGGYKKTLKIFDTKSPGREYSVIPIKQPCSCFAIQETQSNIIATGSWNCAINLYDLRTPKLGSLVTLEEHVGGITFLKFNANAESLFSGARKDNNLLEWDMRNFSKPLRKLNRTVKTNQRIYFDLTPGEKWLASGDTDGLIRIWDLKSEKDTEEYSFELHKDCCNGVSFHPSRPMLATCSGQYHFMEGGGDGEPHEPREEVYENSLIFWWIGEMSKDKDKVDVEKEQEEKMDES